MTTTSGKIVVLKDKNNQNILPKTTSLGVYMKDGKSLEELSSEGVYYEETLDTIQVNRPEIIDKVNTIESGLISVNSQLEQIVIQPEFINKDLTELQNAIDKALAKSLRVVDLGNKTYNINNILRVKGNITLQKGTINFSNNLASIYLYDHASLKELVIDCKNFEKYGGAIRLIDTDGVIIDGVTVLGEQRGESIFTNSRAINTVIRNCNFPDTGWGILFNDGGDRQADGIDYSGQSIGSGLQILNCQFGKSDKLKDGDAIEINTPNHRFNDIIVKNCVVHKTNAANDGNGIGFGFAQCDNVLCEGNTLKNIAGAGAIHFEWCTDAKAINNSIYDGIYAIQAVTGDNYKILNNSIYGSEYGLFCMADSADQTNLRIEGNYFNGLTKYGIVIQRAKYVDIINNTIINYMSTNNTAIISFQDSQSGVGVKFSNVKNNKIIKGNGVDRSGKGTIATSANSTENLFENNYFEGYETYSVNTNTNTNRLVNYVRGTGRKGKLIYSEGTPQGYYPSNVGDIAIDIINGDFYKGTGGGNNWSKINSQ